MPGISVIGIDTAGGKIIGPGAPNCTVNGAPISLVGDAVERHGAGTHANPVMAQGSAWMSWNGIPVVRATSAANCGHTATGQANWNIE